MEVNTPQTAKHPLPHLIKHYQFHQTILLGGLLAFAYWFNTISGERGFFPFDQSIVFDGAYRVLQGQIPFKDFALPVGPVTFWQQALFFKLLGVNYTAYISGASMINAAYTLVVALIMCMLFPDQKLLAYIAGLLTAIWFYPPFGTPWMEQTSFFYSGLGLLLLLTGLLKEDLHPRISLTLIAASGSFGFLSFMCKQNTGGFYLLIYVITIAAWHRRQFKKSLRDGAALAAGYTLGLGTFMFWLVKISDWGNFQQYFLQIPSGIGAQRLRNIDFLRVMKVYELHHLYELLVVTVAAILVALGLLFFHGLAPPHTPDRQEKLRWMTAWMLIGMVIVQLLFHDTTNNSIAGSMQLFGLETAITLGLLIPSTGFDNVGKARLGLQIRLVGVILLAVAGIYSMWHGVQVSLDRSVHGGFEKSVFGEYMQVEGLEGLRWPQHYIVKDPIRERDVERIVDYLREANQPFFVFPDFTMLYGLVNVEPPQPLLWFDNRLTYLNTENDELDSWIVSSLIEHEVSLVVVERGSWYGTVHRLRHFPELQAYIEREFNRGPRFGNFLVYKRDASGQ